MSSSNWRNVITIDLWPISKQTGFWGPGWGHFFTTPSFREGNQKFVKCPPDNVEKKFLAHISLHTLGRSPQIKRRGTSQKNKEDSHGAWKDSDAGWKRGPHWWERRNWMSDVVPSVPLMDERELAVYLGWRPVAFRKYGRMAPAQNSSEYRAGPYGTVWKILRSGLQIVLGRPHHKILKGDIDMAVNTKGLLYKIY